LRKQEETTCLPHLTPSTAGWSTGTFSVPMTTIDITRP
jgi:hypothetical protein